MKKIMLAILMATSLSAMAKGSSSAAGPSAEESASIITPAVATDGLRTTRFSRTNEGHTVFCPSNVEEYNWRDSICTVGKRSAWVFAPQMVPAGKTYVGFRIVSGSYGATSYDIFWK